jgi:hypothetical protein
MVRTKQLIHRWLQWMNHFATLHHSFGFASLGDLNGLSFLIGMVKAISKEQK